MRREALAQTGRDAQVFAGKGHRMTKQRRQIIAALQAARRYLTAQELYERLQSRRLRIGLATIYRTLEALRELGVVSTSSPKAGEASYVWCQIEHHHHAICKRCGRVDDVPCKALGNYERILSRAGFALTDHRLEFFGVCARCS
jgi:Fur family ferric uptake transcriptional regulator